MAFDDRGPRSRYLPVAACIMLCLISPLGGLAQGSIPPIMPEMTRHFSSEPNAGLLIRLMVSGYSAAMVLGALVGGFLAERIGTLRLLIVSLACYALFGAACYALDNLYLMVASRILLGVFYSCAGVMAMSLLTTRVAPEARDRWLGFYIVSATFGAMVLMVAIGSVARIGWREVFLIFLIGLPIALAIAVTFPREAQEPGSAPTPAVAAAAARAAGIPWSLILFAVLCGAVTTTTFMYLPYHLADIGKADSQLLAVTMLLCTALSGVMSAAYGWIRKRCSVVQIFVGSFAVTAFGLLFTIAAADWPMIMLGIAIYGAGFGAAVPNLFSAAAAAAPTELRPRMLGFVRAGFYAGPLLAQVLLEVVFTYSGAGSAVAAIAALCLAGILVSLLLRRVLVPAY